MTFPKPIVQKPAVQSRFWSPSRPLKVSKQCFPYYFTVENREPRKVLLIFASLDHTFNEKLPEKRKRTQSLALVALAFKRLTFFEYIDHDMFELFAIVVLGTFLVLAVKYPSQPRRDEQVSSRPTASQRSARKQHHCNAASSL